MFSKKEEEKLERVNNFELGNQMLKLAQHNKKSNIFLNAGRGNPNWLNTKARFAFNRLVEFGVREAERTFHQGELAGTTEREGMLERFRTFLTPKNHSADSFWLEILDDLQVEFPGAVEDCLKEWVDGALGNDYPTPPRMLRFCEQVVNRYLESTLYDREKLAHATNCFAVEGGTAAIVYLFRSLRANQLIQPGDKIAMNTPVFTPYLQIPQLSDYELVEVSLASCEENQWELTPSEIDKLSDPAIKAFFIVNPTNPGSKAYDQQVLREIQKVVQKNPKLMIITDDVYGTFAENFQSVYAVAPHNTLLVYSFSKLYGCTGWRLGVVALHKENVFDQLLRELAPSKKAALDERLKTVSLEPEKMKFIDRMVAESRSIGLYHTAGLSTPQQVMMTLFALTHLMCRGTSDLYIEQAKELVARRYHQLFQALAIPEDSSPENTKYYSLIDVYRVAESRFGKEFRTFLETKFERIDFLLNLAEKNGVVLMDGVGFGSESGMLRISQANLPTEDYEKIGRQVLELLDEYYVQFQKSKA